MNCRDFRELIDSYLCNELLTETNHEVLRHLEICADCRNEIEVRRNLRKTLQAAVKNCPEFKICDKFSQALNAKLKSGISLNQKPKKVFWTRTNSLLAVAASLILVFSLGFWFLQNFSSDQNDFEKAKDENAATQNIQFASLESLALGDHIQCTINHKLPQTSPDFEFSPPKYKGLQQTVMVSLKDSAEKYELKNSHICKFEGHIFAHLVLEHHGKTLSVLATDLPNSSEALKSEEILNRALDGYQIARFDAKNQAIFIVSDLSERENFATANLLNMPIRRHFSGDEQAKIFYLAMFR